MIQHARAYLNRGLRPIPVEPRGKKPLVPWKAYQNEAPTHDELDIWWTKWPDANIGLVLGHGVFAVDMDGDGAANLLRQAGIAIPVNAPCSKTGNGYHIFLRSTDPVGDSVGLLSTNGAKPQVDIRGLGYVVAPPSIHPTGRIYEWLVPLNDEIPQAPAALLNLIARPKQTVTGNTPDWFETAIKGVAEGSRSATCAKLAGALLWGGMDPNMAKAILRASFAPGCRPPYPPEEADKTVDSIAAKDRLKRGAEEHEVGMALHKEPGPYHGPWGGRLVKGFPTIMHGEGGQGKSYLAMALAMAAAAGLDFPGGDLPGGPVLYLDFELCLEEQLRRAYRIARGFGLSKPPEGLFYWQGGRPLRDISAQLKRRIAEQQYQLIILDSLGPGAGVDNESAEKIIPVMKAITEFNVTSLLLDHQSKRQEGQAYSSKSPFGSVYKVNLSRSILRLERQEGEPKTLTMTATQTKHNFGALADDLPVVLRFNDDTVTVFRGADATPAHIQVWNALHYAMSSQELAEIFSELSERTIYRAVHKLRTDGMIVEADRRGKTVLWRRADGEKPV